MKIVIITPYYFPVKGGVTTFVKNLFESIKNKQDVCAYVITREGRNDRNIYSFNYPMWLFVLRTFYVLNKLKPDVIHSHSWWYTLLPGILYKYIHPRTRIIHTLHTQPTGDEIKSIKSKIFQFFLSQCDTLTFVSKSQMNEIDKHLKITSPKKVIYGAVSRRKANEKEIIKIRNNFSLDGKRPIISFLGVLVYEKKAEGVKRLIESIKILKPKYPKILLLVIGDGVFRNNLEESVPRLDLKDNVIFAGFRENIFDFLALTDIYAHISLQEALGLSLIEAMSAGLPVIAANSGGIPEVIENGENGILVEPNPVAIADAIKELYENKQKMIKLGENARIDIERRFGLDRMSDEFVQLYIEAKH